MAKPSARWQAKLILLVVGTCAGFLVAECAVRAFVSEPELVQVERGRYRLSSNRRIGYEPIPSFEPTEKKVQNHDYLHAANSLGFRDREHELALPEGHKRVIIIGDSVTAGTGVMELEKIFSSRIDVALGDTVDVMNFGVTGYNTEQEVETLRVKGLAYEPDLVVVAFCLNDRERNDGGLLKALLNASKGKRVSKDTSFLHHIALYRFWYYRIRSAHKTRPAGYGRLNQDTVEASLERLAKIAKDEGFEVVVAVFPDLKKLDDYTRLGEHASVSEAARRNGFRVLDLLEPMQRCGGNVGIDRYHLTTRGHECAGRAISDYLRGIL